MFEKLKQAIDRALSSLEAKSGGDDQEVRDLLAGMREELIQAKARVPVLEEDLEKVRRAREAELKRAADCERRAKQALAIDDEDTVRVALEFEQKHRKRAEMLAQKAAAAEEELQLQREAVADMTRRFKEAMSRRDALGIRRRRASATRDLRGGGESAADTFDRLAERIERGESLHDAAREVDRELDGGLDPDLEAELDRLAVESDPEDLAERQLEELKRRLAEEEGSG